jgi:hypothetical protein
MERLVESDPVTDVVAMAMMLYSFPTLQVAQIDAIAVFPGQGEHWRVQGALAEWGAGTLRSDYLLVAGDNPRERTRIALTLEALQQSPFNLTMLTGVHCQVDAEHTREQAEFIRERTETLGIESVVLAVSPYHLLRAYCTLLKAYDGAARVPLIYPGPIRVSPSKTIPETGLTSWDLAPGEVRRIIEYQEKGHVATKDELAYHLARLWERA